MSINVGSSQNRLTEVNLGRLKKILFKGKYF